MDIPADYRLLEGSERQLAPGARFISPADPNEPLSVTIVVRRRPDAPPLPDLENMRTVPQERRTLVSPEEFAASYGAADEDLQHIADFVQSKGLTVEETSIARRTAVVSGTVAQFNDAFAVELGRYESPDQTYRGREGSISVPAELVGVIEGVFGLDNRRIGGHNSGAPITQNLTPPQVAGFYNFPIGAATGQTIGILTMTGNSAGYRYGDIQKFFASLGSGFTAPTIVDVNIDGSLNSPGGTLEDEGEILQDICISSSIAQGATIAVYFAPYTQQGWVDAIGRAVYPNPGDPRPSVLSTSWYISEGDDAPTLMVNGVTTAFVKAVSDAIQTTAYVGSTVFAACGDIGSDGTVLDATGEHVLYHDGKAHVQYPGSDPGVVSCGGTIVNVSGSSFTEVTWNDVSSATGGGVSDFFPLPYYQSGVGVPNSVNDGHQGRGVPDVAGNASPSSGYAMSVNGASWTADGISAVAPLYAGLIAVINARLG